MSKLSSSDKITISVMLDTIFSIDDLHKEIGVEHLSRRTLDNIVRDMGFRKGRSNKKLLALVQARAVQEQVICQRTTNPAHEKTTGSTLSEAPMMAGNTRSQQTQRTRKVQKNIGLNSGNE